MTSRTPNLNQSVKPEMIAFEFTQDLGKIRAPELRAAFKAQSLAFCNEVQQLVTTWYFLLCTLLKNQE